MNVKVLKFGGTSLADATSIRKVMEILKKETNNKLIIVLSASSGITDLLIHLCEICPRLNSEEESKQITNKIESHHLQLIVELFENSEQGAKCIQAVDFLFHSLKNLIEGVRILQEITPKVQAEILSYGEVLSSTIFYNYAVSQGLNSSFFDARELIATDGFHLNAKPDLIKIEANKERLLSFFKISDVVITQGFIGSWAKETTTLGRNGSDLSASLFAYAVNANEVQIWTDVNGILSADPKYVTAPISIPSLHFEEVFEMSFFGAKVLHPETIKPAMLKGIPVKVLNTFNPDNEGTTIYAKVEQNIQEPSLHSIILLPSCLLIEKRLSTETRDFTYYYNFLIENNFNIIHFNGNKIFFKSIVKIDSNKSFYKNLLDEKEIDNLEVDLIALCGYRINEPSSKIYNQIQTIIQELYNFLVHQIIFRASNYSILIVLPSGVGKEVIETLHSIILD
ncbi:MAG: aspartate kinase [Ignavibacteria bacterium]|nr:aspartate kinase [Ignavibacteria bacterium]